MVLHGMQMCKKEGEIEKKKFVFGCFSKLIIKYKVVLSIFQKKVLPLQEVFGN
jgi:hypothetical protein